MGEVLFVSKPIGPPWHDSSKNLVRDLAEHLPRHRAHIMVERGRGFGMPGVVSEPVYRRHRVGFAPALIDQLQVLRELATGPSRDLWHFFFAPNPRSSTAARLAVGWRRVPSVQTVCSAPRQDVSVNRVLFADRVVVLSRHTQARFLDAGVEDTRLVRIPPSVPPLAPPSAEAVDVCYVRHGIPRDAGPVLIYPGDLEFSAGADRALEVLEDLASEMGAPRLVIAARAKTRRADRRRWELAERAAAMGIADRVHFLGEVADIHALLAGATVVLLPSETLYAKMDLPLVLLEAMQLARPVVVLGGTPAAELAEAGAARAVAPQRDALAQAVGDLLASPEEATALAERGRRYVAQEHDPAAMAKRYALLYDELLVS